MVESSAIALSIKCDGAAADRFGSVGVTRMDGEVRALVVRQS